MRKTSFVVLASFLLGGTALAADLPVKAPAYKAPPAAAFTWTGFYVGGNVGWGLYHFTSTNVATVNSTNFPAGYSSSADLDGFLGGAQVGYDWQFAPNWLVGVGGDFDWADIKGDENNSGVLNPLVVSHIHSSITWLATATAHLGYVLDNNWLLYAKGGGAWEHTKTDSNTTNPAGVIVTTISGDHARSGWTAGGGAEYRFARNWSALLEYDYVDFGTATQSNTVTMGTTAPVVTGASVQRDNTAHMHVIKLGVNYRL